ncbi:hypothetical protein ABBQ38_015043 [Trebouxia sp. C0009 RCD-2024]
MPKLDLAAISAIGDLNVASELPISTLTDAKLLSVVEQPPSQGASLLDDRSDSAMLGSRPSGPPIHSPSGLTLTAQGTLALIGHNRQARALHQAWWGTCLVTSVGACPPNPSAPDPPKRLQRT